MRRVSRSRRVLRGTSLLALVLLTLPGLSLDAGAEATSPQRAPDSNRRSHARPISVVAQLEYCRELVEEQEPSKLLAMCFHHARRLLEEGLRLRRAEPSPSRHLEEQLESGAREVAARLEALSFEDRGRLERELDVLDQAILSLQVKLSRIAASEGVQLSLVSRGGVSLGSWQAGFLYSVTEWAKNRPGRRSGPAAADAAFSTVTGASAGAVNGFAAAIEGCKGPNLVASDSLYYQVWIDLGLFGRHGRAGLFPGRQDGATALSLFANQALEETLGKAEGYIENGGQLPACQVDFGFVTTHLDRAESPVHVAHDGTPILTTKKLKEKFTVRLAFPDASSADSSAESSTLRISNIGPSKAFASDQIYYAGLGHSEEVPLKSLLLAIRASGAFPAAFPPVPLTYTQYVPGPNDTVLARRQVATFIDGGVLDNTPVGLAVALDAWRGDSTHPNPYLEGLIPQEPRTYIFLEPGVTSWVRGREGHAAPGTRKRDLIKTYLGFAGDLLATTMDAQLTNTAEQLPFVRRERGDWTKPRLSVPERHMPITGARFAHFMAFLERDFRIFDFYVGMADAHSYLQREQCLYAAEGASCDAVGKLSQLDADLKRANPLYRCIRAYYESEEFQVLERISTDQLPSECETLTEVVCDEPGWQDSEESVRAFLWSRRVSTEPEEDRCIEPTITNHNFRALLAGMHNYKVWMQSDEYSEDGEFDRFFDELSMRARTERFIYVDLPTYQLSDDGYLDSREAKQAFRSLMQDGIDRLAAEQEGASKYVLRLGGRAGADLAYERDYPKRIIGVGVALNGLEGAYGQRLGRSTWRWDSLLRVFRLQQETYDVGLSPITSELYLSTQATWILSPVKYADVELGAGWAVSELVAYSSGSPGHVAFRTGPRSYVALVVVQRIYVAVNLDFYPISHVGPAYRNAVNPVTRDWSLNLSGGWRFLF